MACDTHGYFLNGTRQKVGLSVNTGDIVWLEPLDLQRGSLDQTAKYCLASSPNVDVIGLGSNQVQVTIGSTTTRYKVVLSAPVTIALDVQFIVFDNGLQPKNTIETKGFSITVEGTADSGQAPQAPSLRQAIRRPPAIQAADGEEVRFSLLQADGQGALYQASNNASAGDSVALIDYYLFLNGGTPPDALSLQESFDRSGAYVFLEGDVDPATLLGELAKALSQDQTSFSRLAWRLSAGDYQVVQSSVASAVYENATVAIGSWQLLLGRNTTISLADSAPGILLKKASGEDSIQVQVVSNNVPQLAGTLPEEVLLPLAGDHRGSLTWAWDWGHYRLGEDLGGNLRLFFGGDAQSASVAQYPLFTPAPDPGPFPAINLYFNVYLQPLAPLDDSRTRMALDLDQPNELTSRYLSSTTNAPVSIVPAKPGGQGLTAGFGFAKNTGQQESDRYLCPVGEFDVEALTGSNGADRIQIRGGIAGTEYVLAKPGDRLSFRSGMPAFAKDYDPARGRPTDLDGQLTTSWLRVLRQQANGTSAAAAEVVDTSYCAQPSSSTYFGAEIDPRYSFPIAVGASLVQFDKPQDEVLFPMLPYGGVFYQDPDKGIPNPNPDLSAENLAAIERQVAARDRRSQLEPEFDKEFGPIFFDTSTNIAFNGGFARTPLGLLAGLNPEAGGTPPAGTIQRIILALSPQIPGQFLQLDPNPSSGGKHRDDYGVGVVNPTFSNTTLNDNLFLVATDQTPFEPFSNQIKLGDFTFEVSLGNAENKAIGVFKFVPGVSARSLIEDTDAWTTLIGGASESEVQKRLKDYLKVADDGGDLFASFRKMVDDPNWNGLLIFNCPLNYQALPLDIQILLGGIKGQLRAHHFGITINRVEEERTVKYSSLFSVIHYQEDFATPAKYPDFQVLLLNVSYVNSKLVVFDSKIAFSIKHLFGSPVTLKVGPENERYKATGTIVIDGVYTLFEDGTGSLVFATKEPRSFVYDTGSGSFTPLTAQSVSNATLVPVTQSAGEGDCASIASSQFRLDGLLAFRDDIGGDLFSYGEVSNDLPSKGLAIAGYAFAMQTCIKADNTAYLKGGIDTQLDGMKVDQALSQARKDSLEQTFPSQIEALIYTKDGMKPVDNGEWQVGVGGASFKGAPVYSLTFDVPLGILGALLSLKTDLTAQLFVGWDPNASESEKQVGLLLLLPAEVAGPKGFQFEGIISSSFEYVQLDRFKLSSSTGGGDTFLYALRFVHYQGYLLNLFFNYSSGPKDLGFFGGPGNPGGSNSLFFVGKSADQNWKGPTVSVVLDGIPIIFLGRSYEIRTDPTNPNVIDDVFDKLNPLTDKTVEEFVNLVFANASLYNSDAGIAFAIKFSFKSLALTAVLHDSSFYGAQIKLTPKKKEKNGDKNGENGGKDSIARLAEGALEAVASSLPATTDADNGSKGGFLDKIQDFTFTIIYRKVSDEVGVWSADIYLNLGQLNIGAAQLTLPNFSISIWTNGDWRFAIGWPFDGDSAHPITVQFQAGPVPVIAKAGFYLGKLSSAAAPEQFGTEFNLIWTFGLGLAAGVGKEFKQGPLKAGASLILGLTVEGFLASFSGKMTEEGVDYYWWGVSLSLTGNVFGKVDFKVIAVDLSLTITITLAFAIETVHSTPLQMTAAVKVKASIKIAFIKIKFSFSTKLEIFSTTFGTGPVAKLSGPTPPKQLDAQALSGVRRSYAETPYRSPGFRAPGPPFVRAAQASPVTVSIDFQLQPTSTSADGSTWAPQGVATLMLESGGLSSPFGLLTKGLAEWLIDQYGVGDNFSQQLESTAAALQAGEFNDQVAQALSSSFVFAIGPADYAADTEVVSLPMPPSLGLVYAGSPVVVATDRASRDSFGARRLPSNFTDMIAAYFEGSEMGAALAESEDSTAGLVFDEYFVMLAQQLIQLLIETGAPDLKAALDKLDLGDLGGFVSRFLMGGVRLPDPDNPDKLEALYLLTGQQFALRMSDGQWVLDAELVATSSTPSWIKVADPTKSSLQPSMVHTSGPSAPPWVLGQLRALAEKPLIFPNNNNVNWDRSGTASVISTFSEDVMQAIRDWRTQNPSKAGPWLVQELVGGESDQSQQVDLADGGIPWSASAALSLPVRLAAIPDPSGEPGAILPNIFSLLGTDEANRASLQALLDDSAAVIQSVDLLVSPSRGNWESSQTPNVLVRTDLSTSTLPPAAAALASVEEAKADDGSGCANYAKPGQGGEELKRFLRLVWEVSVVHSTGFYLQVKGLDLSMFDEGPADLMLLVRVGTEGSTVQATAYLNALAGKAPEGGKAIFSTLAGDAQGTPVKGYTAAYPGGSVGWSITWPNAPDEADASGADFLQGLYQMVSYRVEKIDGQSVDEPWSRPVTAQDESPQAAGSTTWNYQRAFETTQAGENRYAAIGDKFTVRISIEDVFGNSLPSSLLPNVDLNVVYNDDILGLGDWAGTQVYYLVTDAGGVQLQLQFSLDPSVVQDSEGKVDPEQLERTTLLYRQLLDQLTDPNMSAGIQTGGILATGILRQLVGGASLLSGLAGYVQPIVKWLEEGATGNPPAAVTLAMALDKSHPAAWPGDLQELAVILALERADVPAEIADKAPGVQRSNSPIQPVEETSKEDDPSGLTTFANNFERAYYPFDGKEGVVKVATGINSDLASQRFGRRSIWLQRWSKEAGTAVDILNDEKHPPVFYAPPPLSRQLISREVQGLRDYSSPSDWKEVSQVFSSVDMDRWAADFLATVETIFSPQMAPAVADRSTRTSQGELYDPFVTNKESLAGSVSDKVDYIYVEPEGTGNPASARETWRQALLRTLENGYGFSTLTQLEALVRLHGKIEPGGDPNNPPRIYGAVQVPGESSQKSLPYSLTPTTLPLVDGINWLNFLASAQDPAAQRAFTLDLNYEVNQLEHLRDGTASACGYTPSSWLTFVLQQNPAPLPQRQQNTLTQPIGTTRIPIPLRTYPPLPKLLAASPSQKETIAAISDALTWSFHMTVERSSSDQDSLNLSLAFNQKQPVSAPPPALSALASGREAPKDLFAALARFVFEYPKLASYIDKIADGSEESVLAVKEFSELIAGAAATWTKWVPLQPPLGGMASADSQSDLEVWNFEIQNQEASVNLAVTASWSRGPGAPPWPDIKGYSKISDDGKTAIYRPDGGKPLESLQLSWDGFYVLDYQNVRPSAYTERNRNLAVPPQQTNPDFVYRTETVSWPTPIVPLINAQKFIELPSGSSLQAALQSMLEQITTPPSGSLTNGTSPFLEFETSIDYRYQVMANKGNSTFSLLPVFLVDDSVKPGQEGTTAQNIANNLSAWRNATRAHSEQSSLRFPLTAFATTIVSEDDRLPLVQFQGLVIPVPDDDPGWW